MKYAVLLILACLLTLGANQLAVDPVEIEEWTVPWADSRPRDPYVDGRGRVWFVGQKAHYIAYLEPESGEFRRYELEPGTGPHNLVVDGEGIVWFAGNLKGYIGRLDPESGAITKYDMPDPAARDPHTLAFNSEGDLWFTVQGGNFVGLFMPGTGDVHLIKLPTARARPYGIVVDQNDRPWFTEFGTNKIGTVDPQSTVDPRSMELEEIALPREGARPRRLAITSDGAIWYVDYRGGFLGRIDPATREVDEWPAPAGDASRPYGMAVDDRDRLWFVETGVRPNRFVGFDAATLEFFSVTDIESGGGSVRHMFFHAPTHTIWFGTDANTIGRAQLP